MATRHPLRVLIALVFCLVLAGGARAQSENVNLLANVDSYSSYSDVWGYSAPNGTEIAILGLSNGTSFIDVTNPAIPEEVLYIPGSSSIWRDFKTYGTHAYIVDDQAGEGLIIVDLSDPLNPVQVNQLTNRFTTAHNVWIDQELGLLFACGAGAGTVIYDLTQNPANPTWIYNFDDFYIHDLYSQDGVAYMGAVYDGRLYTVDLTQLPASMPVLDFLVTDDAFTHNVWTTEDGAYALTTDEVGGGHLTIVDVSDPANIFRVGEYVHPDNPGAIIHNVTVKGDFAYVAWYTNGLEIIDLSNPLAPERAGYYDTHPSGSASFDGAWGVYPYANSGNIYVSDISTGLYVLEFDTNFGTLQGTLTDAATTSPIGNATVEIPLEGITRTTNGDGFWKANLDPGSYDVEVSAFGYYPISFSANVVLGQVTVEDRALDPVPTGTLAGTVEHNPQGGDIFGPAAGADVILVGTPLATQTDAGGSFSFPDAVPEGDYTVEVVLFGYGRTTSQVTVTGGGLTTRNFTLYKSGIVDDFEVGSGWTTTSTASTGQWERVDPRGTENNGRPIQPEDDHTTPPGTDCYITQQAQVGGSYSDNDIDNGTVTLISPSFDVTGIEDPWVTYHRYYLNDGNGTVDDVFTVEISSNNGSTWEQVSVLAVTRDFWERVDFRIADFVTPSGQVKVRFIAEDEGSGSIVEAGIDDFEVYGPASTTDAPVGTDELGTRLLGALPNPFPAFGGGTLRFQIPRAQEIRLEVLDVLGRRVRTVAEGRFEAGRHSVPWDGRDDLGRTVPGGIYFQRFVTEEEAAGRKMVVIR